MFVQSGGCCDGSSPICLREGELLVGSNDLLLGEVGGAPFYVDAELYERWRSPRLVIDIEPGGGDSFSLEGSDGVHFVALTETTASRSACCTSPARPLGSSAGCTFKPW